MNSIFLFQHGNAPQLRQPTRMESFLSVAKSLIVRGLIIYFISSFFRGPKAPQSTNISPAGPVTQAKNIFTDGTPLTLYIYLSESEILDDYHHSNLFWIKENIVYGDWTAGPNKDGIFEVDKNVPITENMKNNGSLYLHAFLTRLGNSPDPKSKNYDADQMSSTFKQINR